MIKKLVEYAKQNSKCESDDFELNCTQYTIGESI